jgi:hypothetical protein
MSKILDLAHVRRLLTLSELSLLQLLLRGDAVSDHHCDLNMRDLSLPEHWLNHTTRVHIVLGIGYHSLCSRMSGIDSRRCGIT